MTLDVQPGKTFNMTIIYRIFLFWTHYGQKPLSTPITMYKSDLPTLPIFGQHLRVFPYQMYIHLSHFWLAGMITSWPRYESESSQQNTMQCVTPTVIGVLISHKLHCYTTPCVNHGWQSNTWFLDWLDLENKPGRYWALKNIYCMQSYF